MVCAIPRSWSIWVAAGLATWATLGCQAKPKVPDDPLFVTRKPIETSPETAAPVLTAYSEPAMPLDPVALARQKQTRSVPGILTNHPSQPPDSSPESRPIPKAP
jgi:hypothetical protein